jgi:tellurite resistance protein TerC
MASGLLFPFAQYYWFYGVFVLFVCAMLALDLGVFHRTSREVSYKEALGWSSFWISLALLFNYGLYHFALWKFHHDPVIAKQVGLEFLTGFVVEKALAVDNIFVFVVVFRYFGIPLRYQHKVLFFGVLGALLFRAAFIALGAALMQYQAIVWIFGAFLVFTGVKMVFSSETEIEPEKNFALRWIRKLIPVSDTLEGGKFFGIKNGVRYATPLFVALLFLEISDILFAVDSVPAIFAVTKEPLLVFTSNIFAILGLRSLYFLLAGMVEQFRFLKYGLAFVLVFVGLKMTILAWAFGGHFPIVPSLLIIFGAIAASVLASWLLPPSGVPHKQNPS